MAKKGKTGYLGMFAFVAILINAIILLSIDSLVKTI